MLPEMVPPPVHRRRVAWLDGVRGAAAVFVVLHHIWLSTWSDFPRNAGPWWVEPLLYGHLAVAVFIVVSGYSLALGPLRRGWELPLGRFLTRRAWRILPPYWTALVVSTVVVGVLIQSQLPATTLGKGFLVHGLLLQDVFGSFSPNGAFWSIAVEWQVYFCFPLMLWLARRHALATAVLVTVAVVVVAHLLAIAVAPLSRIDHLTPQFLALFALGVLAADLGQRDLSATVRRRLRWAAIAGLVILVAAALAAGSIWMVAQFFWVDLFFGTVVACGLVLMSAGGLGALRRVLSSRIGATTGAFSYSLYLMHVPILAILETFVIRPLHLPLLAAFGLGLLLGLPLILGLCFLFYLAVEKPFVEHRGREALEAVPFVRWVRRLGGPRGEAPPGVPPRRGPSEPGVPAGGGSGDRR